MEEVTNIKECIICGNDELYNYMNLGDVPLANSFPNVPASIAFTPIKRYPLRLNFCNNCSHSQLTHTVNPEILFKDYAYVSGTTKTLNDHFDAYADYCLHRLGIRFTRARVLEIGSNDGSLLEKFAAKGSVVVGVDPAENIAKIAEEKGIVTLVRYWSDAVASTLEYTPFHVIIGNNVFAHNPDPVSFLKACLRVLEPDGFISLEFPLFTNSVSTLDAGQIYHEHINYFTLSSFAKAVDLCGELKVEDLIEFPDIHGGTVRFILKRKDEHCQKMLNMLKTEKLQGFNDVAKYTAFSDEVALNLFNLMKACKVQDTLGYKLVAYGAAAKASTLISTMDDVLPIQYVIDDAPLKVGKFMPGTNVPIVSSKVAEEDYNNLAIIIFPHNFKKEIKERLKLVRKKESLDSVINIVPKVSVESLHE